ncbi:hypothetical protein [Coleofasciculus chthonoplastes]|uniref:hypothetical protein n=1 Tax=Coleofasciculus chthonoplastes TaxID=64178 RepID=UPI003303A52D
MCIYTHQTVSPSSPNPNSGPPSFPPAWQAPTVIISDGAYGLGLFPGDPPTPADLADWYAPHIKAWS